MQIKKKGIVFLAGILILSGIGFLLLGTDAPAFFRWYLILIVAGIGFYPLTSILFKSFSDGGWLFSKIIGIALCGYVVWLLSGFHVIQFTNRRSIVVTLILIGVCWISFMLWKKPEQPDINLIFAEEFVFLLIFLMWTWFVCFRPEASGTEKYMDYGFMAAMDRSLYLPAKDIWYGSEIINYYYGGQYYGVFIAKLCYVPIKQAYNLFRTMIAAFGFCLPMTLTGHMLRDKLRSHKHSYLWSAAGAAIAGAAVSLAGNVHYVLYGLFGSVLKPEGYESYWFPSSTRYIGYNPDVADKCIHEFPSYSFVLGDVHAHMINIMFVITVLALLYAWGRNVRNDQIRRTQEEKRKSEREKKRPPQYDPKHKRNTYAEFLKRNILEPRLILAAFFIGIFRWTNYWDYIIYLTVALITSVFVSIHRYQRDTKKVFLSLLIHILMLLLISFAVSLPFMMDFDTMVSGIGIAENHTMLHQMLILWGLPAGVSVLLIVSVLIQYHRNYRRLRQMSGEGYGYLKESGNRTAFREGSGQLDSDEMEDGEKEDIQNGRFCSFFRIVSQPDRFAIILAVSAMGLIFIPELVYVRDIYENGYARSNTMFKLTYQAYIMFGIVMAYTFVSVFATAKKKLVKGITIAFFAVFLLTLGYFPYSVREWFGNVFDISRFQGLDATAFLEEDYPEDAEAIRWVEANIEGQPIVLEANGDSYSEYCRVSAMTGVPTVEGWYVHEWLWRSDPADLNQKAADIAAIYTSEERENVVQLLRSYEVDFIFVGSCEREKYEAINDELLRSLGDIVYDNGETYIVRVETGMN